MLPSSRVLVSLFVAALIIPTDSYAFNSLLSEEAVREAYFLGQRRDESTTRFLAKYKQLLSRPDTGPHIASVEFLTPFAELVAHSRDTVEYSAQQAEEEHRGHEETVVINLEVVLTESYGALIQRPTSNHSGAPIGFAFRSPDFWKDIEIQVIAKDKIIKPTRFDGTPIYLDDVMSGATMRLEFPARAFDSDSVTVRVVPPEGPEVFVDLDLAALR
jgi:hypothetical protein